MRVRPLGGSAGLLPPHRWAARQPDQEVIEMALPDENAEVLRAIARATPPTPVDVLGTTLEFLVAPGTPATVHAS